MGDCELEDLSHVHRLFLYQFAVACIDLDHSAFVCRDVYALVQGTPHAVSVFEVS